MVLLSDNYTELGVNKPCEQEYKFYTDLNGQKVLIGEDTRNIFEEFQTVKKK